MSEMSFAASALAALVLLGFLVRFYRKNMAHTVRSGDTGRVIRGLIIIGGSIVLAIWWRAHN